MSASRQKKRDVLVFGAGPAGMTAAICAARGGARVTLVEKTDAVGRKLSMTGNGRCNLSNRNLSPLAYNERARDRMTGWLDRMGVGALVTFLESVGLFTRFEGEGLYPVSGQATSVVSALRAECERLGIRLITGAQLKTLDREPGGAFSCLAGGVSHAGDTVILATGARSGPGSCKASGDTYYLCERLGIEIVPQHPALVPLLVDDGTLPQRTGVRTFARVVLEADGEEIADETGEVQFTKTSISGIPVLQASRAASVAAAYGTAVTARIDFLPEFSKEQWIRWRKALVRGRQDVAVSRLLCGLLNRELVAAVLMRLQISPESAWRELSEEKQNALWRMCRAFPVRITGVGDFTRAQATTGGVSLEEIDDDCQSVKLPGLYLIGELVDVDGRCGGYNLHWAFMSGMFAGVHAATGRSFSSADAGRGVR